MTQLIIVIGSLVLDFATIITLSYLTGQAADRLDLGPLWQAASIVATVYILANLLWVVAPNAQRAGHGVSGLIQNYNEGMRRRREQEDKENGENNPGNMESGGKRHRNWIGFGRSKSDMVMKPSILEAGDFLGLPEWTDQEADVNDAPPQNSVPWFDSGFLGYDIRKS